MEIEGNGCLLASLLIEPLVLWWIHFIELFKHCSYCFKCEVFDQFLQYITLFGNIDKLIKNKSKMT